MAKKKRKKTQLKTCDDRYGDVLASMVDLLESARRASARAVNGVMTATYWEIGRRIVEFEQGGEGRAEYGDELVPRLSHDLTHRLGRGFGVVNLSYMRRFYLCWPTEQIFQTVSENSSVPILQTPSEKLPPLSARLQPVGATDLTMIETIAAAFPLPWSQYVKLLPNQVMAAEYKLALPDEAALIAELEKAQRQFARTHTTPDRLPAPKARKKTATKRKKIAKKKKSSKTRK